MIPSCKFFTNTRLEEFHLCKLMAEREWFASSGVKAFIPQSEIIGRRIIQKNQQRLGKEKKNVERSWRHIENRFFSIVRNFRHRVLLKRYKIQITMFGCEGQYRPPETLIIRLLKKHDRDSILETIGHELLHLVFHNFFQHKKLNYSYREGMIDALILQSGLHDLFPRYKKQPIGKIRSRILASILPLSSHSFAPSKKPVDNWPLTRNRGGVNLILSQRKGRQRF